MCLIKFEGEENSECGHFLHVRILNLFRLKLKYNRLTGKLSPTYHYFY